MLDAFIPRHLERPLIWPETVEFRLYQKTIADAASTRNTLVILPTALGKTVISAIVAAHVLSQYRDARVLIMAPTRPLVMQHRDSFLRLLTLRPQDTLLLTGKTAPEYRRALWEGGARVIFSTPQVVRNDIWAQRLSLEAYGLLVFDECHRAVKKYAYTDIAASYVAQARYPLILGMTASPGAKLERILAVCRNLYIEWIAYRSEEDPDVKPYIQPIAVDWRRVDLPKEYIEAKSLIQRMLDRRLYWLYQRGILKRRPEYATRRSLIEVGDELRFMLEESIEEERRGIFTAIINQSLALTLFHMLELLETQGLWTLNAFLEKVGREKAAKRSYAILVNEPEYQTLRCFGDAGFVEHPKLRVLRQLVGDQVQRKPTSRMLVFTQYRDTASHLVADLNMVDGVRAARFVGQASTLRDKGLTQEEQAERIRMLEDGALNVLVATSIAEEGLDIPAVDRVIFYEPIPSEIRYIQRRGRTGRKAPGKVTILAANDSLDMIYLYASQRRTEKMRSIAESVNRKLQPVLRTRPKPTPNPLTPKELKAIALDARQAQDEAQIKTERDTVKPFTRKVEHASRRIYLKLLEKGEAGADIDQLAVEMGLDGVKRLTVKGAIDKLMKKGFVKEEGSGRYMAAAAVKPQGNTYEIAVEKISRESADVIVDATWKATLIPEDYDGPRSLIKKRSRFRAIATLYHVSGDLYIRVKKVTEILNRA